MVRLAPIRFIQTVIHTIQDHGDVRLLCLRDPDGWELPAASPGAHIDLYLSNGLTRSYSLCGDPDNPHEYCVAVKRQDGGKGGSRYIHETLRKGDGMRVSLPRNTFPQLSVDHKHIFIAGGIGVTPFIPMMRLLDRLNTPYRLHLFYRGVPPLHKLLSAVGHCGTINLHDRARDHNTRVQALLNEPRDDTHVYFCGPLAMLSDFDHAAQAWLPSNVHKEYFVPPVAPVSEKSYTLELKKSGRKVDVQAGETALQALQQAGVAVSSSCEGGICRACMVPWLGGEPDHHDLCLSQEERKRYFTPCVSGCKGAEMLVDL